MKEQTKKNLEEQILDLLKNQAKSKLTDFCIVWSEDPRSSIQFCENGKVVPYIISLENV